MLKKIFSMLIISMSVVSTFAQTATAPTTGTGTSGNPYEIATWQNLYWLSQNSAEWGKYFKQTANIDFSTASPSINTWDTNQGWTPIGNSTTNFTGNYDGEDFTVSGLYVSRSTTDHVGLFGYVNGGTISNLGVTGVNITGKDNVGGLAGYSNTSSTIQNSYSTGSVSGSNSAGGLVGYNIGSSVIQNSYSTVSVTGSASFAGGLAGVNNGGTIQNSYSMGSVSGSSNDIGGLVGWNNSTIQNSYSTGSVSGSGINIGGFTGYNGGTVTDAFWDTQTSGQASSSGGTGKTTSEMKNHRTFTDQTTTGLTTAWDFVSNPNNDAANNDYWDMDQLISVNSGYPILSWQAGADNSVSLEVAPTTGTGTSGSPYEIATWQQLYWLSQNSAEWGKYFKQTANIDLSAASPSINTWDTNQGWTPIGNGITNFTGNYDGQNYTVSGLYISRSSTDHVGLFGYVNGGTISNLGVTSVNVTGKESVGGLVGWSNTSSTIQNSYSTGSVSGSSHYVGGLVGYNRATIQNSYSTVSVTGSASFVGGLAGVNNSGTIQNSYSTGSVSGTNNDIGGLVGWNNSTIQNSYSTGSVSGSSNVGGLTGYNIGTVTDAFWDTQTSGTTTSSSGTGKTTSEMKDHGTFTDQTTVGLTTAWDFVSNPNDDAANNDYWDMDQLGTVNNGYPILSWQTGADNSLSSLQTAPTTGTGTSGNPYEIATWQQLYWLSQNSAEWGKYFKQTANIDLSTASPSINTWSSGQGWTPIGNSTTKFTGNYDGQDFTVSGLYISRSSSDNVGLFGYVNGGTISNLGVTGADITGKENVGGLTGFTNNSSTIQNSYSTGSVSGSGSIGGLVGANYGGSTIQNSYSTSSASGSGNSVGGLAGDNYTGSMIQNSYSTGSVSGSVGVGGLIGVNYASSTVENSYSTGSVNGTSSVGGLMGSNNTATVQNSYSTGSVNGSGNIGGLVGFDSGGTVTDSFWNTQTSGQASSVGGTGKTTAEMKEYGTFTDQTTTGLTTAWDFEGNPHDDAANNDYWDMDQLGTVNSGYPILSWQAGADNILAIEPEINLKQSATNIADGGSYDYGSKALGTDTDIVFTIENTGTANLTITTPLTLGGADAGQFSIVSQPAIATISASGSTTFTVRFSPTSTGAKTASISIANNDSDENPYDLTLNGTGVANPPTVTTRSIGSISSTTAWGGGNVTADGGASVTARGVCWSTSADPTTADSKTSDGTGTGIFISNIAGLTQNTTYHVRAYATNSAGTAYGSDSSFTTLGPEINLKQSTTNIADGGSYDYGSKALGTDTNIGFTIENTGTSDLTITTPLTIGGTDASQFNIVAQPSAQTIAPGSTTNFMVGFSPTSTGAKTATISITNSDSDENPYDLILNGTGISNLPIVTTTTISSITSFTASGGGEVTSDGGSSITARGVCWSTSADPTTADSKTSDGTGTGTFTSSITGLTENTTYHVRAYATNSVGTSYGDDLSFTTLGPEINIKRSTTNIADGGSYDYGSKALGTDTDIVFTIENTGTANLTITTPLTLGGTDAGQFSIAAQPAASIISASSSTTFTVRFSPTSTGAKTASISIANNDSDENPYNLTLNGTGAANLPMVTTTAISSIASTTASGGGNVTNDGGSSITARGVCWSTSADPTTADSKTTDGTGTGTFTSSITGLTENTTYHVRAYTTNSAGTAYGSDVSFTTTYAEINIKQSTTNIVTGGVYNYGSKALGTDTDIVFTIENTGTADLTLTTPLTLGGTDAGQFSIAVQPATATISASGSTTFTVRFSPSSTGAKNASIGIANNDSDENPFALNLNGTGAANPPTVTTTTISSITANTAASGGEVTSDGGSSITARGVCWSTSADPTTADSKTSDGTDTGTFTSSITGLTQNTTYHVRAYATNSAGTSYGSDLSFTTLGPEINLKQSTTTIADGGSYDYGSKALGTDTDIVFTIENTGTADLTLTTPLTLGGTDAGQFSIAAQPAASIISASSSTTFTVRFSPTSTGAKTASISIANNDSDENPYNLTLNGTGTAPEINLKRSTTNIADGGSYDYGSKALGTDTDIVFTIENTGTADLTITTPLTLGGTDASQFSIASQPGSSTISASGSTTFTVRFSPSSAGAKTASISIANNDSDENPYALNLNGTGVANLPIVTTGSISSITSTTASGGGEVTSDGGSSITARGVCWSTSADPTTADSKTTDGTGTGTFTSSITGLTENTTYHVRAYATNSAGTVYGSDISFTTTYTEINIKQSTTDIADGGSYDYGSKALGTDTDIVFTIENTGTANLTITTPLTLGGTDAGQFSITSQPATATISASSSTTFTVRFSPTSTGAKNATISIANNDSDENPYNLTLNGTGTANLPTVATTTISSITSTTASGGGNVTADGGASVTARGVCWSTSAFPTIADSKTSDGTGTGTFTSSITGLTENTTYHVRAYATNSAGTVYGSDIDFTTTYAEINLKQSTTNIADGGSYDYGSKALGADTDIVFTIENTGTANLTITIPLTIGGTDASQFSIAEQPATATISASGSTTFTVRFSPTSTGAKTASISLTNNDSNENPYDLTLDGTGTAPEINLKQSTTNIADGGSYDYGNNALGTNTDIVFTIENTGTADLTITTPLSIGGTDASQFSIASQPGSSTISVSDSTTFTVRFSPTSTGAKTASISIANNDSDENPYNLTLNGTGIYNTDYGDAPSSFGSAGHTYKPDLCLGTGVTGDAGNYGNGGASGDVDDGVVSFETWVNGTVVGPGYLPDGTIGSVTMDDDTYAVLAKASNNTGTAAQLVGWIDWNRNGAFDDPSERSVTVLDGVTGNVPDGSDNVDVVIYWDGQAKDGTATFARFRITTDASFKSSSSPSPTGDVDDGEVEDYQIGDGSLPVELTSFLVENTLEGVLCTWNTESEFENLGFILERRIKGDPSTQASSWTEIASYKTSEALMGKGTTSIPTDYEYVDKLVEPNITYEYRLADVAYDGIVTYHATRTVTVEQKPLSSTIESFTVLPAYPNPFNPTTTITYGLENNSKVEIRIYDISGKLITTLLKTEQQQGWHSIEWNGTDANYNQVPAGIYLSRITSNNTIKTIKLMLLK